MLSGLLLVSVPAQVYAEPEPSRKEEVIYIMTDQSGKVTDIEAVNIFDGGEITDYGNYSAVKMLNTTDEISQNGDTITFRSDADKVYYQGTVKKAEIPWNISIRYFLDGTEYFPKDIAGKSGKLEIRFSVSENENASGNFYDDYALQASFTMDTELCKNIVSNGATAANVGSDKQLTYTILPGKGIDTVIKADVTDFEMDAVSINGIKLNINFEVDDSALTDKVNEIVSAVSDLNDGTLELRDGAGSLYDAAKTLNGKTGELNSGVGSLANGAGELYSGLSGIAAKNDQLTKAAYSAYEGLCTAAAAALNSQLNANGIQSVTLTPSNYSEVLMGLLEKMDADAVYEQAYQKALLTVTQQVEAQADTLYRGYIESQADSIYFAYVLSNADTLYSQVAAQAVYEQLLKEGYTEQQAAAFLQSPEGQVAVAQAVEKLTDEQKTRILNAAVLGLSDEQKQQILDGAENSLTEEQKGQIKETYIKQLMVSDDVTVQINEAVAAVGNAAKQVSELKGQLDSYGMFYQGLLDYTGAVDEAAKWAKTFKLNMDALYDNTQKLDISVGELSDAVCKLYGGTKDLANGTAEFADKTSDMDGQIRDEIDSLTSSIFKTDAKPASFVSDKNTNVDSVQFVIKTEAVEKAETDTIDQAEEAPLTFWQKLLRLFGLY